MEQENISYQRNTESEALGPLEIHNTEKVPSTHACVPLTVARRGGPLPSPHRAPWLTQWLPAGHLCGTRGRVDSVDQTQSPPSHVICHAGPPPPRASMGPSTAFPPLFQWRGGGAGPPSAHCHPLLDLSVTRGVLIVQQQALQGSEVFTKIPTRSNLRLPSM